MRFSRIIYPILLCVLLIKPSFAIEEELFAKHVEIKDGSNLSIADCVASAFKNSPKIRRYKYNLDIAKSRVGIARAQYFPVISAGAGFYNENNSNSIYYNSYYRELPNVGVAINKMIWDFGKTTAYIKMEDFYRIGAEYEFMDSICATLFDVKAKYYKVLKEQALGRVVQKRVELFERFVKNAKHKPDKTSAEVNLTKAKLDLISAGNGYRNAIVDLNNSMYLENQPKYTVQDTPTFNLRENFTTKLNNDAFTAEVFNFPMEKAVDMAYENSPDLKVLVSTRNAMDQSLKYIKRVYFPELSANVGYNFLNTNEMSNNGLNVGVNVTSAVNLMELKHSIKGADAELNIADNEINLFKKDLYFEVKRAFNNVDKAQREIPVAESVLTQASSSLTVIEAQYIADQNNVDYTAYRDAIIDYTDALIKYVNAVYDYNLALIQVEMAMHYHIVDIHHKSEHAVHYHSDDLIKHLTEALGCDEHEKHKDKKNKRQEKL
ncbi:TolC family protein [bacterium]|nr:TolC family protein [bacterium]